MNLKTYNAIMIIATVIAWFGFFIIINNFDPHQSSLTVFILFYLVLFLGILGTLSMIGFWIRKLAYHHKEVPGTIVTESFRQAVIFAGVFIIASWLQAGRVLTWWNILLLIIFASIVEFLILLFRQNENNKSNP